MRSFRNQYKAEVNLRPIPNELFHQTRKKMRQAPRRRKIRWGILIPACALIALASVTAVAFGSGQFAKFSGPVYQKKLTSSVPAAVQNAVGRDVRKTVKENGLSVTVNRTACDGKNLYVDFTVKSTDSVPLQESTEFRRSQLARQRFAQTALTAGGKTTDCWSFRTDSAAVPDTAQFEAIARGDFSGQNGKQVTLSLQNFTDEVDSCEDAGSLFQNLGELYRSMTPEPAKDFLKTGLFDVYADKSLAAPSWTIPAGISVSSFPASIPVPSSTISGFIKPGNTAASRICSTSASRPETPRRHPR